jgi:hypothetical protein
MLQIHALQFRREAWQQVDAFFWICKAYENPLVACEPIRSRDAQSRAAELDKGSFFAIAEHVLSLGRRVSSYLWLGWLVVFLGFYIIKNDINNISNNLLEL